MVDRIDMHTHVFNVRYLPIEGIMRSRGVPGLIAKGLAKLLNARTGDDIEPHAMHLAAAALAAGGAEGELGAVEGVDGAERPATSADAIQQLVDGTPKELIDDPDVRQALALVENVPLHQFAAAAAEHAATDAAPAKFVALYNQISLMHPSGIFQTAEDYIRWFQFLTHSERVIMQTLLDTYGSDVHLFIHHMMDMENFYNPGHCQYDFVNDQLPRTRRLVNANQGRLLTFVAWNPERANDLSVIKRALDDKDAVGVKFYPPNGYKPNEERHFPLYRELVQRDAPIFAHCTPVGMEAKPHQTGVFSDPTLWLEVLNREEFKKLRLCLGHAGGDEPWFGRIPFAGSFAAKAVDLAARFDNVYIEFGYHDDVLDDARRELFIQRLKSILDAHPAVASKILYGTDWHLIEKIENHQKYFARFAEAFQDSRLAPFADAFFMTNAVKYLRLADFATDFAAIHGENHPVVDHLRGVLEVAEAKQQAP
jgi:predicted TIM-barrel fold metal-dependent hydrolase